MPRTTKSLTYSIVGLSADDKRSVSMTMRKFVKRGIRINEATAPIRTAEYAARPIVHRPPVVVDGRTITGSKNGHPIVNDVSDRKAEVAATIAAARATNEFPACGEVTRKGVQHNKGFAFTKRETAAFHASWCAAYAEAHPELA